MACEQAGLSLVAVHSLARGLEALRTQGPALVLLSLSTEHADAATAARIASELGPGRLLLSVPEASLDRSVEAVRAGVAAVLAEPLAPDALAMSLLASRPVASARALPPADHAEPIVGTSAPMARLFETLARVAATPATVLVVGESGTGKELVARALHRESPRRERPFVAVNCAAIPESLLESELFGHERGAFTGALARKIGRFERAHAGTLFLDEIGDMSLVLQAKILRALEEREVERVGGDAVVPVDVRVVAATHRDLRARIADGQFREDLYYRLAVVTLELPPLRDRGEDVEALALHFAAQFARRYARPIEGIAEDALGRLREHAWPGNVRELRNVMDRAVVLASGPVIRAEDLLLGDRSPSAAPTSDAGWGGYPPTLSLQDVEARHIARVLRHTGGHMGEAAELLGVHRNTLTRKVRAAGLPEVGES
jgi:two-component system response regulator HydG